METFFYVMGGVLVLLALGISAFGVRSDDFPSKGIMRVGVLVVALVVLATAYGAVQLSEDEQEHRLAEENVAASEEAQITTEANTPAAGQGTPSAEQQSPVGGSGQGPSGDGEQVFLDNGCGSCHTLAALGNEAQGTIGPNLDEALVDQDATFIETSIVDPSAEVAAGFGDNIMPATFGSSISPEDLQALVAYLQESTQSAAGGGSDSSK